MPYLHLIDEAIGLLNTEIRLIEWRIKYPEQLQQRTNKQALSPLYLADRTTLINIMEIVSGGGDGVSIPEESSERCRRSAHQTGYRPADERLRSGKHCYSGIR